MYVWGTFSHDDGKPAFLVPHQAVMRTAQGGASVFLVGADNKLVSVPVTTDETNGTNWVVRGNDKFYDGAKLVVEGGERALVPLKPGAVVTPVPFGEKDKPAGASAGASAK
jgi:membrane fusion protein (multidrug efflux system)